MKKLLSLLLAFVMVGSICAVAIEPIEAVVIDGSGTSANELGSVTLEIEPLTIVEGTNGFFDYASEWKEEEYKYYHYSSDEIKENLVYTITWPDGSVTTQEDESIQYGGESYYLWVYCDGQSFENQWLPENTYTVDVLLYNSTITVSTQASIYIEKSPVKEIEVEPLTLEKGIHGRWNETNYFYYLPQGCVNYKITWKDGSVTDHTGAYVEYNGKKYEIDVETDQSKYNKWEVGNNYTATMSFMGATAEVPIYIENHPIKEIIFEPINLRENIDGYWYNQNSDTEYFNYRLEEYINYTIIWTDGRVTNHTDYYVEYKGNEYNLSVNTNQSYEKQWQAGNTYTVDARLMGIKTDVPVYIKKCPIQEITFKPITLLEGTDGIWVEDYNYETGEFDLKYYAYMLRDKYEYTITWEDGSVTTTHTGTYVEYEGESYRIDIQTHQSYYNQWKPGNTYMVTVTLMGKMIEVPVYIKKLVEKIEFEPITLVENVRGSWKADYNKETDEYTPKYFCYDIDQNLKYTITWVDGSVTTHYENNVEYNDNKYWLGRYTNQSYDNQWQPNNTYTAVMTFMGASIEIPVSIQKNPIKEIVFEPITLRENIDGYWDSKYNEETEKYDLEYFRYNYWDKLEYKIIWEDGSVTTHYYEYIIYNDEWYELGTNSGQSYENPWQPGNTYIVKATLMGVETEISVYIKKSPVREIAFEPITLLEGFDGSLDVDLIDETTGKYTDEYFQYSLRNDLKYTVTWEDGSVTTHTNSTVEYNGEEYYLDLSTLQSYKNQWKPGNTYMVEATLIGRSAKIPVYIEKGPIKEVVFEPITLRENIDGYLHSEYNEETEEFDLEYFRYSLWDNLEYKIIWEDGSVTTHTESYIEYNDKCCDVEIVAYQSYDNPWKEGNTYTAKIELAGKSQEVAVHIKKILLGDVDGDGGVTILDATAIQRQLAKLHNNVFVADMADTDKDGKVSIIDATQIQRFLAKLIPQL